MSLRCMGSLFPLLWVLKSRIFSWPLVRCIIWMYLLMLAVICLECSGNWLPKVGGWGVHLPRCCLPKWHCVARRPLCGPQPPCQTQYVTTLWQMTYTHTRTDCVPSPFLYHYSAPSPLPWVHLFFLGFFPVLCYRVRFMGWLVSPHRHICPFRWHFTAGVLF